MGVRIITKKLSRSYAKKKNSNKTQSKEKNKTQKTRTINKTKNFKSKDKKRSHSKNLRVTKRVRNIATTTRNIKQKILPTVVGVFLVILAGVVIVEYYGNTKIIIQRQLVGSTNVERAWNFYQEEGFSEEATAGILGNFMRESKMNPAAEEIGNKIGYGIAQWSFTRRTDFEKWTKENNFLVSSLEGQLNFSIYEMQKMKFGKYSYAQFKKLKDVREATEVFEKHFEIAGVVALDERIKYAQETYNQYSKTKDRSS